MAARDDDQTRVRSRLGAHRRDSGLTQEQMARLTGMSLANYQRLERGQLEHPDVRYLTNCALVLRLELVDVVDPSLLEWWPFDQSSAPTPPTDEQLDAARARTVRQKRR